jgi:dTDP-4-amino-4,6-dideoxygalactose transaminase
MIEFNRPTVLGSEITYITQAMQNNKISGDGEFTKKCHQWFEQRLKCKKVLLTPSCTHALEMAALLLDVKEGDEIIMPSYTFVSTANAFVLRGAKIVFVDINPLTMNIDETKIEPAITNRTKAIVPVHYAGVACKMDTIMEIANRHNVYVIEDAAQGMLSSYKGKELGTIGHLGAYSFHETKNYTSAGEGGLLIINDETFLQRAQVIREKGTNRSAFSQGLVDKYSWIDLGSSYLLSDLSAAYLWAQLLQAESIKEKRLQNWKLYESSLKELLDTKQINMVSIPPYASHNAHMFYIKVKRSQRHELLEYLRKNTIESVFHYVPLHSSEAGKSFGDFHGEDTYTTKESESLLRLPMHYALTEQEVIEVCRVLKEFFYEE